MPLRKKIRTGYFITFLLLMITYFFIFMATWNLQKEHERVSSGYKSENKIAELKNEVVEAESAVRGYFITRDESFLKPHQQIETKVQRIYDELKHLEATNPQQTLLLDSIKQLIDLRLALMKKNIGLFQSAGGQNTAETDSNRRSGQTILDSVDILSQRFIDAEEELMVKTKNQLSGTFSTINLITIISVLTSIFAIFYSLYNYNKESQARDESTKKNVEYQKELEKHIDELQRMDAEVQELKSLEKFTATGRIARTIAHEVRNPLTNIALAAEQLREIEQTSDSAMLLEMINRNSIRINQLVSDLLNATKAIELNLQKVDINKILDDTLAMASDRINLAGVQVEKYYAKDICAVRVDEKIIKVALLNIIVNAIEAMEKDKGILTLRTKRDGDNCVIQIEDNGSGMDHDTMQRLFEPYFTSKSKGNGLGLTNCQNIILSHRGKIEVQSKTGKGSVFTVTLKIAD
ncbi:MAG TPA: CHASE3 domain-containing protein [Chitinophagaceae bacterium]|nr:CHASE3 domain-containing protein [Chitinophagaceae bacterium]